MSEKEIICIGCPMGCHVLLSIGPSGEIISFSGNDCKQGEIYTTQEYQYPVRVFTGTVSTKGSVRPLLPVKTSSAIPKDKLRECAFFTSQITIKPPLAMGEIVIRNILGTGAALVCSDELPS